VLSRRETTDGHVFPDTTCFGFGREDRGWNGCDLGLVAMVDGALGFGSALAGLGFLALSAVEWKTVTGRETISFNVRV
jgi:hypothetical protein